MSVSSTDVDPYISSSSSLLYAPLNLHHHFLSMFLYLYLYLLFSFLLLLLILLFLLLHKVQLIVWCYDHVP